MHAGAAVDHQAEEVLGRGPAGGGGAGAAAAQAARPLPGPRARREQVDQSRVRP